MTTSKTNRDEREASPDGMTASERAMAESESVAPAPPLPPWREYFGDAYEVPRWIANAYRDESTEGEPCPRFDLTQWSADGDRRLGTLWVEHPAELQRDVAGGPRFVFEGRGRIEVDDDETARVVSVAVAFALRVRSQVRERLLEVVQADGGGPDCGTLALCDADRIMRDVLAEHLLTPLTDEGRDVAIQAWRLARERRFFVGERTAACDPIHDCPRLRADPRFRVDDR